MIAKRKANVKKMAMDLKSLVGGASAEKPVDTVATAAPPQKAALASKLKNIGKRYVEIPLVFYIVTISGGEIDQ